MAKGNTNKNTITQKRIGSPKLFVYLAGGAALVVDLFLLIVLLAGMLPWVYYLAPAVLFAADLVFVLLSVFTNFRARYSIWEFALYIPIVLAALAGEGYLLLAREGEIVTVAALLLFFTSHIFAAAAILFACLRAARLGKGVRTAAIFLSCILLLLSAGYLFFMIGSGFFGQSLSYRTVVYEYDEEEEGYVASDVLEGQGGAVRIPGAFNGKPVVAVDCGIFVRDDVKSVVLDCGTDVAFLSAQRIASAANQEFAAVYAPKDDFDAFRSVFFGLARESGASAYLSFADGFLPVVEKNETYVTFSYDTSSLERMNGELFATWFGKKGDVFTMDYFKTEGRKVAVLEHADQTNDADLDWSYKNADGTILRGFSNGGSPLVGSAVNEGIANVKVDFDKIYKIYLEGDNDTVYEPSEEHSGSLVGEERLGFRYLTASLGDAYLLEGARAGFTAAYRYSAQAGSASSGNTFSSLSALLAQAHAEDSLYLYEEWTLNAPVITSISTGKPQDAAVYGDAVTFTSAATSPAEGIGLSYSWSTAASDTKSGNTFTLDRVSPKTDSGDYTLTVTASGAGTSLTSTATQSISLTVAKKNLTGTWSTVAQVYDAQQRNVTYDLQEEDFVDGDEVTATVAERNGKTVKTVDSYAFTATLDESWDELYVLTNPSYSFAIVPKQVELRWTLDGETEYSKTYDGQTHTVNATADFLGGDDVEIAVTVGSGESVKNAKTYTATASIENKNYTLQNPSRSVTINKKAVTVEWETKQTFVYDGEEHTVKATAVKDKVAEENPEEEIVYGGDTKVKNYRAAAYRVTASLPATSNYEFATAQSVEFTITQKPVTVNWGETSLTYNGGAQYPHVVSVATPVSGENVVEMIVYAGDTSAKNYKAGEYTVEAHLPVDCNYKFDSAQSTTFTIAQKTVTVQWETTQTFVYDGHRHTVRAASLQGKIAGEDPESTLIYAGDTAVTDYKADVYTVTVTLPATSNYKFAAAQSVTFTITQRPVTPAWGQKAFTYNGTAQYPRVTALNGAVAEADGLGDISYSGDTGATDYKDGNYTVTATLSAGSNYKFDTTQTAEFVIKRRQVTITWADADFTYDGSEHKLQAARLGNTVGDDSVSLLTYSYDKPSPRDAGTYTVTARLAESGNYIFSDNSMESSKTYTIAKKRVTFSWTGDDFTENGEGQAPTATTEDLVGGEEIRYEYFNGGVKMGEKPQTAGEYTVRACVDSENYDFVNDEQSFTIKAQEDVE